MADNLARNQAMEFVASCGPTQAEMIQEILENNGIECALQGESAANALPAAGELDEVRIWVQPRDAERARELVEEFFTPVSDEALEQAALEESEPEGGNR